MQPLFDRVRLHVHAGFLRHRYDSIYGLLHGVPPIQNVSTGASDCKPISTRFSSRSPGSA
jgi:hypothetical protein